MRNGVRCMSDDTLKEDLFLLLGYLLTSAHGLYEEPQGYGPFRLLDTAARLLAIQETYGLTDPFLQEMRRKMDAERFGTGNDEQLEAFLDQICQQYASELKERCAKLEG